MKVCNKCNLSKELSEFHNRSVSPDGKANTCKECDNERRYKQSRSKLAVIKNIYRHQVENSKVRGHSAPDYTLDDLVDYLMSNPSFNSLYEDWVVNKFDMWSIPSVDRIDEKLGYSFSNIQVVTFLENKRNHDNGRLRGEVITSQMKRILKFSKDSGEFICEYPSLGVASRDSGVPADKIGRCAKQKRLTAGGYVWKYAEECGK